MKVILFSWSKDGIVQFVGRFIAWFVVQNSICTSGPKTLDANVSQLFAPTASDPVATEARVMETQADDRLALPPLLEEDERAHHDQDKEQQ